MLRAYNLLQLGRLEEAKTEIINAISKGIFDHYEQLMTARVLSQLGQYEVAKEFYQKALSGFELEGYEEMIEQILDGIKEIEKKAKDNS